MFDIQIFSNMNLPADADDGKILICYRDIKQLDSKVVRNVPPG